MSQSDEQAAREEAEGRIPTRPRERFIQAAEDRQRHAQRIFADGFLAGATHGRADDLKVQQTIFETGVDYAQEKAASVCDALAEKYQMEDECSEQIAKECAAAIRADKPETT